MTTLVVGATGATGRHLVADLLNRGEDVKVIVRDRNRLPAKLLNHPRIAIIEAEFHELTDMDLTEIVRGCSAIASCLGHNLTFKGMYGHPRRLVTDTVRRLCQAVWRLKPEERVKFVLMNSSGCRNNDLNEQISFAQKVVIGLIRNLVPPHADNEQAAEFLRVEVGPHDAHIDWSVVRPDGLIDSADVTEYVLHPSPTRSAIFDAGKISRINVGNFMARLITETDTFHHWKGKMPVIYNATA